MDQNISIDINVTKLLDWLISRRHCQKDWQNDIAKIRSKINAALQDMPEHKAIAQLLSGSFINYFYCLKIVEILRETEADTKNIFGHYSSKRMKDWNEIISLYQKNNLYLAEAADFIISMNKYDIPNLKKQITKQKQMENDFKKKEVEAQKAGVTLKNELTHLLKELGLSDKEAGYKAGLIESAKGLTTTHDNIAIQAKNILDIIKHYTTFANSTQPNIKIDMSLIESIAGKGNITMFEYLKGYKPSKVILASIDVEDEDQEVNYDTIDWGLSTDNVQIDVVDSGNLTSSDNSKGLSEKDEDVAEGNLALSLLDDFKTRTSFINMLLELRSFLKMRIYESKSEGTLDTFTESTTSLEKMVASVEDILKTLNNATVQHQYYLTHNPRYLEDILKKIMQKKSAIERASAVVGISKERAVESASEAQAISGKVKALTQKCLVLQDQVAADISKKYNGRDVFLIGGL